MRILLVEPYFGGSHQAWAEGYARFSSHDVHILSLPARFWTWRMRGGAVTLAIEAERWVNEHGSPDLVLATDMLDLPAFLGAARRSLGDAPVALYFHESQFTYPWSPKLRPDLQYAYVNWSSMQSADLVLFNSAFHRDVVFDQLPRFLGQFPDYRHTEQIQGVLEKTAVLPVGVDLARLDRVPDLRADDVPTILWNQRWEHDKDPAAFFRAMFDLADDGYEFRLAVCGENFRQIPEEFVEAEKRLGSHLVQFGFAPIDDYLRLLRSADIVVSTALHEFFGIAVVEAAYAGAMPILPRRLSYPEIMPASIHDRVLYDEGELLSTIRRELSESSDRAATVAKARAGVARFDWAAIVDSYDGLLSSIL